MSSSVYCNIYKQHNNLQNNAQVHCKMRKELEHPVLEDGSQLRVTDMITYCIRVYAPDENADEGFALDEDMQLMPSSSLACCAKHQTVILTHLQRDAGERYSVSIKGRMSVPHQLFSKYVDTLHPDPSTEVFTACQQGVEDMLETNPTTGEIVPKSAFMCMTNTACVLGLFEMENHEIDENGLFCGQEVLQNEFGSTLSFTIRTIKTQS